MSVNIQVFDKKKLTALYLQHTIFGKREFFPLL